MVVCVGCHTLFPSPRHYLQIVSLSVPPFVAQIVENQELGLDCRVVGHFPILCLNVGIIWAA
jgi:hypothetical protein